VREYVVFVYTYVCLRHAGMHVSLCLYAVLVHVCVFEICVYVMRVCICVYMSADRLLCFLGQGARATISTARVHTCTCAFVYPFIHMKTPRAAAGR